MKTSAKYFGLVVGL